MCRILFFAIFFLNMTVENCHASAHYSNSIIDSSNAHSSSTDTLFATKNLPKETTDKSMDHGCSICHCHMVILKIKTNTLAPLAAIRNIPGKFFYQDLYSFLSVSSFFRPPIA